MFFFKTVFYNKKSSEESYQEETGDSAESHKLLRTDCGKHGTQEGTQYRGQRTQETEHRGRTEGNTEHRTRGIQDTRDTETGYCFCVQRRSNEELASALESASSGHLETEIRGLLKTPARLDASELKASI